jgi:two-component system, NarL family, response regulator YdfI
MRVILAGASRDRDRLRSLVGTGTDGLQIVAEVETLAAATAAIADADAVLVARPARDRSGDVEEPLTPREVEVLELLSEGLPNKGIAERLDISDQTVKFHVASICGKLGAANRTDAVRRAVRRGLVVL